VNYANKYQPYQGYNKDPWLSYGLPGYGRRIRTRNDWYYDRGPSWYFLSRYKMPGTRSEGRRWAFWHCPKNSSGTVYQKRLAHRAFRRLAKQAIRRELAGEEVSHIIRSSSALGTLD